MSNVEIIRNYFEQFFAGEADHSEVRSFLTDDFTYRDPLMSADSAVEYLDQLKAFGDDLELYADVREVVGAGDTVAALVDFQGPDGPIAYAQWFTMRDGKIAQLEVIFDPRSFHDPTGG